MFFFQKASMSRSDKFRATEGSLTIGSSIPWTYHLVPPLKPNLDSRDSST
jgi:hypothetical protein